MLALLVKLTIKPEYHDAFMAATLSDARGSVYDESGCLRFDVLQAASDPHTLYLYEVYRDEQALEAHRLAPHFRHWLATVKDWFDGEPTVHRCVTVFPAEHAWEAIKPRL